MYNLTLRMIKKFRMIEIIIFCEKIRGYFMESSDIFSDSRFTYSVIAILVRNIGFVVIIHAI